MNGIDDSGVNGEHWELRPAYAALMVLAHPQSQNHDSKGVDLATTSQSERDEKRGREIRQREERLGKLERRYEDRMEDCQDGDRRACAEARDIYAEMQLLIRSLPVEPER